MSVHNMPIHMSIYMHAHMSIHMSVHMSVYMCAHMCVDMCVYTCLYTRLYTCLYTCLVHMFYIRLYRCLYLCQQIPFSAYKTCIDIHVQCMYISIWTDRCACYHAYIFISRDKGHSIVPLCRVTCMYATQWLDI